MATLELTTLHCERRQDLTNLDEPRIKVDNSVVWSGVLGKGDSTSLVPTNVEFDDTAEVKLEERDGDKAKQIGSTLTVRASGAGPQPAEFKTSGAYYKLYYRIT